MRVTFSALYHTSFFVVKSLKCFTRYSLGTPTASPLRSSFLTTRPEAWKLHTENVQIGYLDKIFISSFKTPLCEFLNVLYMFWHDDVHELTLTQLSTGRWALPGFWGLSPNALFCILWGLVAASGRRRAPKLRFEPFSSNLMILTSYQK